MKKTESSDLILSTQIRKQRMSILKKRIAVLSHYEKNLAAQIAKTPSKIPTRAPIKTVELLKWYEDIQANSSAEFAQTGLAIVKDLIAELTEEYKLLRGPVPIIRPKYGNTFAGKRPENAALLKTPPL